jgi:hypothetical protein
MLYIVEHKPDMPDGDFCGIINPGCAEISDYLKTWKIRMNNEKPLATIRPDPPPVRMQNFLCRNYIIKRFNKYRQQLH